MISLRVFARNVNNHHYHGHWFEKPEQVYAKHFPSDLNQRHDNNVQIEKRVLFILAIFHAFAFYFLQSDGVGAGCHLLLKIYYF